jgi:hypothetical protein
VALWRTPRVAFEVPSRRSRPVALWRTPRVAFEVPSRRSRPVPPLADAAPGRRATGAHATNRAPRGPTSTAARGLRLHPPIVMTTAATASRCTRAVRETGGALRHAASGARASAPPAHSPASEEMAGSTEPRRCPRCLGGAWARLRLSIRWEMAGFVGASEMPRRLGGMGSAPPEHSLGDGWLAGATEVPRRLGPRASAPPEHSLGDGWLRRGHGDGWS